MWYGSGLADDYDDDDNKTRNTTGARNYFGKGVGLQAAESLFCQKKRIADCPVR